MTGLVARWRLAFRLARCGLAASRNRTTTAVVALAIGVAAVAIEPGGSARSLRAALLGSGVALIVATVAAMQSSPVEQQRRNEHLLDVLGASGSDRRRMHVAEQSLISAPATGLGLVAAALVSFVGGGHISVRAAAKGGLLLPAVLSWMDVARASAAHTGRSRTTRSVSGSTQVAYVVAGLALIALGTALPALSRTFNALTTSLWPGLVAVATGLGLLTSVALTHLTRLLARHAPLPAARLAARFNRRAGIGDATVVGLTATATLIVVVLSVLGAGFTTREAQRRADLPVRHLTAGLHDDEVVVSDLEWVLGLVSSRTHLDLPALRAQLPEAVVAPLTTPAQPLGGGPATTDGPLAPALVVVTPPGATRLGTGTVALATPEVLHVLGLERFAPALAEGRVLALDPQAVDAAGNVTLAPPRIALESETEPIELPAVAVSPDRAGVHLPSVLVSPRSLAGVDLGQLGSLGAVIRLPHAATARDVAVVRRATGDSSEVTTGATADHARLEATRLDAAEGVLLQRGDRRAALVTVCVVVLAAALLALRFATLANRSDDTVLALLGARRGTRRAVEAWRGALTTATGVALGGVVGLVTAAAGLFVYNHFTRLTRTAPLPPIPFEVPPELAALVVLPAAAALFALAATAGRHLGTRPPRRLVVRDT